MDFRRWMIGVGAVVLALCLSAPVFGQEPARPAKRDRCPVCGMFVAPYPHWVTVIEFSDGSHAFFDGPKDMFRYLFDMAKYTREKTKADVAQVYVTEFYTTRLMGVEEVTFITGSDVLGPMGHELVPVAGEANAGTFMKDHGGKRALSVEEITPSDIP
jgi:nitrous oxide reductase accessory protein NosL